MEPRLKSVELLRAKVSTAFRETFNSAPDIVVAAPGRVNLIGEHTDYNDGFVLPAAIDRHVVMAASRRSDRTMQIRALDFADQVQFSLDDQQRQTVSKWSNYERGVAWALEVEGFKLPGMNVVLASDVPIGSGLSSSAAIELATCAAFQELGKLEIDGVRRALICQKAENEYVGMRCGIMDQYIISLGQENHALKIDCRDLSYQLVPLPAGINLVICDTKKRRGLVDSEYNTRRKECEEGARILGVRVLRDVTPGMFAERQDELSEIVRKRCKHVITEDQRVLDAVQAMGQGQMAELGKLLNASHVSLRDDYQVSCRELDIMAEIAWAQPGVLGARMTGAGFGGCTINLVEAPYTQAFAAQVAHKYLAATGQQPDIYACTAVQGAHRLE
ncbi:MAG: galactokinase [Anaerolineae bacterium]